MVKYDERFKQKVIDAYLAGEGGYLAIAKKIDIPSIVTVRKWVSVFRRFGKEDFVRKKFHKTYTVQFKLDVLNYKIRIGDSFIKVALKYGFNEPSIIANCLKNGNLKVLKDSLEQRGANHCLINLVRKKLSK